MIDFTNVINIVIPEGEVSVITRGTEILWQKQTHIKPYKVELEYIESTGTQWIDTEFIPTNDTVLISKMAFTENPKGTNVEQINGVSSTGRCAWGYARSITKSNFYIGIKEKNIDTEVPLDTIPHIFTLNMNGNWSVDDTVNYTDCGSKLPTRSVWLFGRQTGGTTPNPYFIGKFYFVKILKNDTVVRDLIPVLDWDDVPCMYDKVTDTLFYNDGTGEFLYGKL